MASDSTNLTVSNSALAHFGSKRLTDYDNDTSIEAIQCRLHFDETRRALLRMFPWSFAVKRVTLSPESDDPQFEYDCAFKLPSDYLCFLQDYQTDDSWPEDNRYIVENGYILSNGSTVDLVYVADMDDPAQWDDLFHEVFTLALAVKLIIPIAGGGREALGNRQILKQDLDEMYRKAKLACWREMDSSGRSNWNWSRRAVQITGHKAFQRRA